MPQACTHQIYARTLIKRSLPRNQDVFLPAVFIYPATGTLERDYQGNDFHHVAFGERNKKDKLSKEIIKMEKKLDWNSQRHIYKEPIL